MTAQVSKFSKAAVDGCTKGYIGSSILCGVYCLPYVYSVVVVMHPEIL